MRRFYLHTRKGIYYAELVDPETGLKLTAKSTGKRGKDDAVLVVADWLKNGVPTGRMRHRRPARMAFTLASILDVLRTIDLTTEDAVRITDVLKARELLVSAVVAGGDAAEMFNDFLRWFWTYDESEYIQDKIDAGHRIGRAHAAQSLERARKHWFPYFAGRRLGDVTRIDVQAFKRHLSDPALKLAPNTRQRILVVGTTALKWACNEERIPANPTEGILTFSGDPKKRGIPEPAEAAALFKLDWPDEQVKVGNILAATTGLRAGEIVALRREDVGESVLTVRHSYSERDGLKAPKNGETRVVPLRPAMRDTLLHLAETNPHGTSGFLFHGVSPDVPMNPREFLAGLREMLVRLSVGDDASRKQRKEAREEWDRRNVLFHSWRHFYLTHMAGAGTDPRKLMMVSGHKTTRVFEDYANHMTESDLADLGLAAGELFDNVLQFKAASK
ncbi:tyrosine-type recombinase/integrase [bacterium]|nr:tyrosine-type recombinase/integrase [bacterium]